DGLEPGERVAELAQRALEPARAVLELLERLCRIVDDAVEDRRELDLDPVELPADLPLELLEAPQFVVARVHALSSSAGGGAGVDPNHQAPLASAARGAPGASFS